MIATPVTVLPLVEMEKLIRRRFGQGQGGQDGQDGQDWGTCRSPSFLIVLSILFVPRLGWRSYAECALTSVLERVSITFTTAEWSRSPQPSDCIAPNSSWARAEAGREQP